MTRDPSKDASALRHSLVCSLHNSLLPLSPALDLVLALSLSCLSLSLSLEPFTLPDPFVEVALALDRCVYLYVFFSHVRIHCGICCGICCRSRFCDLDWAIFASLPLVLSLSLSLLLPLSLSLFLSFSPLSLARVL